MNIKKSFAITFALSVIVFAVSVTAFGQPDRRPSQFSLYGMHLIGGGQTVSVSVQNPRLFDGEIIPCIRVTIFFDVYAVDGGITNKLRFVRRVTREVDLDGGEAATFDFASSRGGDWVSPSVIARCEANCPSDPSLTRVLSTLSVREGSRTLLNLPAVIKGFDPQPDPPASREQ